MALVVSIVAGMVIARHQQEKNDPVIDGKRMSEWCLLLIEPTPRRESYGYGSNYRTLFEKDRELAVRHLINTVRLYSTPSNWRARVAKIFPEPMARIIRPKPLRPVAARWLAILALSDLARKNPDPVIGRFFLECIHDKNVPVRKVTAYEAGPWLAPNNPELPIRILELALEDAHPEVIRDACRRLLESCPKNECFRDRAKRLLPALYSISCSTNEYPMNAIKVIESTDTTETGVRSSKRVSIRLRSATWRTRPQGYANSS
jgi:hypothetical protein